MGKLYARILYMIRIIRLGDVLEYEKCVQNGSANGGIFSGSCNGDMGNDVVKSELLRDSG